MTARSISTPKVSICARGERSRTLDAPPRLRVSELRHARERRKILVVAPFLDDLGLATAWDVVELRAFDLDGVPAPIVLHLAKKRRGS